MGPNLLHLCLYWHLSRASFHRFMVYFCGSWKQVFLKKHFIVRKSRAYGTIRYTICGKNHSILDGIDLNCSSSRCFQGHLHLRVTGLHDAFSYIFFPFDKFYFKFLQFKGDKLYTKIMLLKIWATVLVQQLKTIAPL